jgi:uncharacterized phage protein (TIGR01671 family)
MNRELKFRVWDTKEKRFIVDGFEESLYLSLNYGLMFINTVGEPVDAGNERYVIQQYTGLKDKNWKEIYEGDIISGVCLNDGPQICVVGFDTWGIFYTKVKFYPCEEWENVAMLCQTQNDVVGNIFENPELLS